MPQPQTPAPSGVMRLYDSRIAPPLPTRLYKGQHLGEMLAILLTRPQLGVDFAKRLARSLAGDIPKEFFLTLMAKALGYHTWIQALQYRSDNGKVIVSARQFPPHPLAVVIDWEEAEELLHVQATLPETTLYTTRH